ncbi:MAG: type IX secretion system sortase PorU, partial [Rhodothermia bacterium]|nr:type IX secretion system sortase PorU [Rhodothermia bacterium]
MLSLQQIKPFEFSVDRARALWANASSWRAFRFTTVLSVALWLVPAVHTAHGQVVSASSTSSQGDVLVTFEIKWPGSLAAALDSAGVMSLGTTLIRAVTGGEFVVSETVDLPSGGSVSVVASEFDVAQVDGSTASTEIITQLTGPIATLEGVGWLRRRRVGNVAVRLVAYDSESGQLRRYRSVTVRVRGGQVEASKQLAASGIFSNPHLGIDRSVLADGRIFKLPITAEGVFKIDRAFINGLGLDPDAVDPAAVQVFGNGGEPLPALNSAPRPADLQPRPTRVVGGGDGSFANSDAIYFYASGPSGWRFNPDASWEHYVHPFSTRNFVFIKIGGGSATEVRQTGFPSFPSPTVTSTVTGRHFIDADVFVWSKEHGSGHTWVSNPIQSGGRFDIMTAVALPGYSGGAAKVSANVAIKSNPTATVELSWGAQSVGSMRATQVISPGAEQPTAASSTGSFSLQAPPGPATLSMTLLPQSGDPQAALDWLRIEYEQSLTATDGVLRFVAPASSSGPHEFRLSGFSQAPVVWDVTDVANISRLATEPRGGAFAFQVDLDGAAPPREFIAFNVASARLLEPDMASEIANQNLHGLAGYPRFIIVAPPLFRDLASELADVRRREGLETQVVTVDQIYNEFSGGLPDMRAVRDYLKFLYDRAPTETDLLRYVLLLGDGHFDFRSLRANVGQSPNLVFPYETAESYHPDRSYTSDDYFGLLDDDEGEWVYRGFGFTSSERVDIGVGRLPAKTVAEARTMLDKIKLYESVESQGAWRGLYTFVADDAFTGATGSRQENDLHMQNIDSVADLVLNDAAPTMNGRKIYAESFEREFLNEFRVPGAKAEILKTIDSGSLIVNYAGHGGPSGLAQEEIFTQEDAATLTNGEKLPIFITATCSFGWWDIDDADSGAETLLLNPNGGAVAMMTTVRLVYTSSDTSSLNPGLNRALNRELFRKDADGLPVRLGDAMIGTKNTSVGLLGNSRKFNLLGDPSMRLGLPAAQATVDDLNGVALDSETGRLPALERITLRGSVRGADGFTDTGFNGRVEITVFDAERRVPIRFRTFMPTPYYEVREDLIWRGSVRAQNGAFTATFVVPKDISYSNDLGRISVYAVGEDSHAIGFTENLVVGGTSANPPDDSEGPVISLFLNDST